MDVQGAFPFNPISDQLEEPMRRHTAAMRRHTAHSSSPVRVDPQKYVTYVTCFMESKSRKRAS